MNPCRPMRGHAYPGTTRLSTEVSNGAFPGTGQVRTPAWSSHSKTVALRGHLLLTTGPSPCSLKYTYVYALWCNKNGVRPFADHFLVLPFLLLSCVLTVCFNRSPAFQRFPDPAQESARGPDLHVVYFGTIGGLPL